ncbi:hypothetical protein [Kitasatospora sp. NPDC056531]|uniref:hypothetical protein n=1 Tax=Kitasatospora sp. NPDC056531 TaxID=3345856 RepID=UPI003693E335
MAPDIFASTTTVKVALARLVGLNILLKTGPRSGTYQLNPRRFWEGNKASQSAACRQLNAPPITPDEQGPRGN